MQHLAARCYGFVILSKYEEEELTSRCSFLFNRLSMHRKQGLRCLVKEIMPHEGYYQGTMLGQMRKDLVGLHSVGIAVYDLREDNYLMGKIVDFSQAHVIPHRNLDMIIYPSTVKEVVWRDLVGFDGIVETWNEEHPAEFYNHPFLPSYDYQQKLRSKETISQRAEQDGLSYQQLAVTKYDWKGQKRLRKLATQGSTATKTEANRISKPKAKRKQGSKRR